MPAPSPIQKLSRADRLRLIKFVCSFAWADLEIAPAEREFIGDLLRRLDLESSERKQVNGWLVSPPPPEAVDPSQIPDAHRRLFLDTIRGVIVADGKIAIEESETLRILEDLVA